MHPIERGDDARRRVSHRRIAPGVPGVKFYFTFGYNTPNRNKYFVIEADDANAARVEMFRLFDREWSMQYDSADAAGVERFGLTRLEFREGEVPNDAL